MKDYSDIKIDWHSEITAKMGYGLQARRMLKPLIDGGADIKLIPDEDYLPPFMKINDPYWDEQIEKSKIKPDSPIRVSYCLPNRYRFNQNSFKIGYSMWETDQYPREWAHHINNTCDMFLAGCPSLLESAKKANIKIPIEVANATLDVSEWVPDGHKVYPSEISKDNVKFLFIGNFIPRKNLEQLILGFAAAFEGCPDVSLIIKTWSHTNDANGKKHIAEAIRHLYNKVTGLISKPKISIITDILDENQIIGLIRGCDAYVSVSKGEGFDLPMMQAMALEKLIVTTRFLAHGDYLNDSNSINIKYTMCPCYDAVAPLYDTYQMWSSPDMESYIESLRTSYNLIKKGEHIKYGKEARNTIINNFSPDVNTEKIAKIFRDIKRKNYKLSTNEKSIKASIKELVK